MSNNDTEKKYNKKSKEKTDIKAKPHNIEAEKSLLGCFLISEDLAVTNVPLMKEYDFYDFKHRAIFKAMEKIVNNNQQLDIVSLIDRLALDNELTQAGGIDYLTDINSFVPSSSNHSKYMDIVQRDSILRKILDVSFEISKNAINSEDSTEALSFAEKEIFNIGERTQSSSLVQIGSAADATLDKIEQITSNKNAYYGVRTGYDRLDLITHGLQKSDLILLAARPACGKTTFALNIATNAAMNGKTVAVFSLEMPSTQLAQRMMCSMEEVDMSLATGGGLSLEDFQKLCNARKALSKSKLYVDDNASTAPQDIISKCRKLARESGGLDLIVVDYLQLMSSKSGRNRDNRQQEVSDLSRMMKLAAKELSVPIILLSQLSRAIESRQKGTSDGEPKLSDLRESGSIEQDADIVMFLYNKYKAPKGNAPILVNLYIAKHRNGETGEIDFMFHRNLVKFKELSISEAIQARDEAMALEKMEKETQKDKKYNDNDYSSNSYSEPNNDVTPSTTQQGFAPQDDTARTNTDGLKLTYNSADDLPSFANNFDEPKDDNVTQDNTYKNMPNNKSTNDNADDDSIPY